MARDAEMSDLDARPAVTTCVPAAGDGPVAELFASRSVPLGGIRGIRVDRVLPHRSLPTVGGFADELVMWWNFVGRGHEEIAAARREWENGDRFGHVTGHGGERVLAPALPGVRLRPRGRR